MKIMIIRPKVNPKERPNIKDNLEELGFLKEIETVVKGMLALPCKVKDKVLPFGFIVHYIALVVTSRE